MKQASSLSLIVALLAACGGGGDKAREHADAGDKPGPEDSGAPDADSATEEDAASEPESDAGFVAPNGVACTEEQRVGGFEVSMLATYTTVDGQVYDGVTRSVGLTEVGAEDGCRLIKKTNPFCDPLCGAGEVCTIDGSCEPEPSSVNLGTVSIAGLAQPVKMKPVQPGNVYFDTSLPEVGVVADEPITLAAKGSNPFTLHAVGVAPLQLITEDFVIDHGKDVKVTWKVPKKGAAKVRIAINVDQHGTSPVTLSCDVDDDGAHTVPSSLIDQLLASGVSGFPTAHVFRESVDSVVQGKLCIDFSVVSHVQRTVRVADHTPCTRNQDCDDGQTCDIPNETCRD